MNIQRRLLLLALAFCCALPASALAARPRVTLLVEHAGESPWNSLLRAGLDRAAGEFGLETRVVVTKPDEDQKAAFLAAAGDSDLVIVASDRLHEILRDNAGNFRRVMFGCIDAGIRGPNIMCVTFADEQAAFLAGAAAAMSAQKAGKEAIGWLSGEDVPAMRSLFNGYSEGARIAVPSMRVILGVAGSFLDSAAAAREARKLLGQGCGVLALAAGAGNPGALAEVRRAGALIVGMDADQSTSYPGHVLTSIIKKADDAVYGIVSAAARGQFRGREIIIQDLAAGGVGIVAPRDSLGRGQDQTGIADIARRLDELRHEIENGGIRIKSLRARTLCDCL